MSGALTRALACAAALCAMNCGGNADGPGGLDSLGVPPNARHDPQAGRVLVVMNTNSADGLAIGHYYARGRGVPDANLVEISTTTDDDISGSAFQSQILAPVLARLHARPGIDFIVLTHGIPLRVSNGNYAVDALLAGADLDLEPIQSFTHDEFVRATSPYFRADAPFHHAIYGFYLATRLDGYTLDDMKGLVDSALSARPETGLFFFDQQVYDRVGINDQLETAMENISAALRQNGFDSFSDGTPAFIAPDVPLMGYWSSGSNDLDYSESVYHALRFRAGSLAETNVSTSARTFHRVSGGQSMIADLITQGVTGVKGYVDEPYTVAVAKPDIMFERYTRGYTLAESFYMASQLLKWKDVVIGDPLCRPYAADGP